MPKAEDYLYPNQIIVEIDDYDGLRTENDRLRAENVDLRRQIIGKDTQIQDLENEDNNLRAEKAELLDFVKHYMGAAYKTGERGSLFYKGERLIAKANDQETDADLPTANDVRGILK